MILIDTLIFDIKNLILSLMLGCPNNFAMCTIAHSNAMCSSYEGVRKFTDMTTIQGPINAHW